MNVTGVMDSVLTFQDMILKIIGVVLILFIAIAIGKGISIYMQRSLKDKIDSEHMNIMQKVAYYGVIVLAIVVFIFPILNIEPSGLLVAGGVVGIVIGFASQSIVGNFISGLFLMTERPVKIGDQVNINNHAGYVEDINMISTIIRTYDGLYMRIPNETVFTTDITNYVANVVRRFDYVVGIRYEDDADQAIEIIQEILDKEPFALKDPPAGIFVDNLGDNSVNILVRIWAPITEWYELKTRLLWVIKKTLGENGIEIPFPQRTVWFASELQTERIPQIGSNENEINETF
ncbi:mechanosensitive ion channel family protein [Methanolobus halotolerans]|uniref:Mechanosensitive ion channel protein MscS n=1 Tax=Methanolobus halotolerans TaxID=2052935 RepID=A0A4E0Q0I2_9EURY|nr:mechanosensitive ion channel family protein [Methanolobus halotolerans]TGC11536.1 mechanosensitive ion channel protein MscS [Methanolobus halotolerans]